MKSCDVLALQECEDDVACKELEDAFQLVGCAAASETRGFVHLYVRHGMKCEVLETIADYPGVSVRIFPEEESAHSEAFVVSTVHLPTGDCASRRGLLLQKVCGKHGRDAARVIVLGDMNAKDDEITHVCKELKLREARYVGFSWGTPGNRFYEDMTGYGPGLRV